MRLYITQETLAQVNNFLAANGWELVASEGCAVLKDKTVEPVLLAKVRVPIGMIYEFTSYEALGKAVADGRILRSDEVIEGKVLGNVGGLLMLYCGS